MSTPARPAHTDLTDYVGTFRLDSIGTRYKCHSVSPGDPFPLVVAPVGHSGRLARCSAAQWDAWKGVEPKRFDIGLLLASNEPTRLIAIRYLELRGNHEPAVIPLYVMTKCSPGKGPDEALLTRWTKPLTVSQALGHLGWQ